MKPAAILALLFLALAVLSFLLYFLLPAILSFVMGAPMGFDWDEACTAQPPIEPVYDCKSKPEDPCVYPLGVGLNFFCPILRQYLLWFGGICLLLSLVSAAYHFFFAEKVKSGSGHP
jgi:hypothetical protein